MFINTQWTIRSSFVTAFFLIAIIIYGGFYFILIYPRMYGQTRVGEKLPCLSKRKKIDYADLEIRKCVAQLNKMNTNNARTKRPTTLDVILHKKNQKRSVYYFTHGRTINEEVLMEVEAEKESPFYLASDIQNFNCRTKSGKESLDRTKSQNRSDQPRRLCDDKLERLFIPEPSITLPGKGVVDQIDYYKAVAGRPIREKFDISNYLRDLQQLFLTRLLTGYRFNEMYLMEEQYLKEKRRLREIQQKYHFYSDCYDKFLAEDHTSSIVLLKEAEVESKKSKAKGEKIRHLLRICGWYRSKILSLDEHWRRSKIFQKFLYQVSPLWWRNKYDYIHRMEDTGTIDLSETTIFGRQKSSSLNTVHSVVTIIDEFLDNVAQSEPPQLYFQNPMELHHIFHEMERSNLLALLQCEELTPPAQQMVYGLQRARSHFVTEVKILQEHMKSLEEEVLYEENRIRECEQRAKAISFGYFRDLIVDKNILNLYVNVEDCYEVCVAPNDGNLSPLMMMRGIEHKQESLMAALDKLPNEIVLKALASCYREDAKIFREAQEATRMITQIENLMKTLRKSLEPKREGKPGRRLIWRSDPPKENMDMAVPPNPLMKEQLDYLYFFTDFCQARDDPEIGKQLYAKRPVNLIKRD